MDEKEKSNVEIDRRSERLWEILCHLTGLAGFILPPFGQIIGPLVIWLIKRNELPSVDEYGKEAVNFQISMTIYMFIAGILCFILIGIPLLIALVITDLVSIIVASLKASNGELFRYPATIRFIR